MLSILLNGIFCLPLEDDASEYDYEYDYENLGDWGLGKLQIPKDGVCSTANDSKVPNKPCVFPFKFKNVVYEGCPIDLKARSYDNS